MQSGTLKLIVVVACAAGCASPDLRGTDTIPGDSLSVDDIPLVSSISLPSSGGHFDCYIRDGLVFISAWDGGILIYDIGNGIRSGTLLRPALVSSFIPSTDGLPGGPQVHNSWWFHNPVSHENRYLFVGQETGTVIGSASLGDLHVLDISNLAAPLEVASLRIPDAGVHNFWMDEASQVLYAAWYNGGVVALDVSGTLSGDLTDRIIAHVTPGGVGNTYVWGVQYRDSTVYVADMLSGFWALDPMTLATRGGGNNVPERYTSELWVSGPFAYTGTTLSRNGHNGDLVNIWNVSTGSPVLVDSMAIPGIGRVGDLGVTPDGKLLIVGTEAGTDAGLYVYSLREPTVPKLVARRIVDGPFHTSKIAVLNGRTYVFCSSLENALIRIYDISDLPS